MLSVLELEYVYEKSYESLLFSTEEIDDMGRPLRYIWENMGYKTISAATDEGVDMMPEFTPEIVAERVQKVYRLTLLFIFRTHLISAGI